MKSFATLNDLVAVYGNQPQAIQAMLDYDYMCEKPQPQLVCIIDKLQRAGQEKKVYFYGGTEVFIPSYKSLAEGVTSSKSTILINFASSRTACSVTQAALEIPVLEKVIIIAEDVPERDSLLLKALAKKNGKVVIGPATVGGIIAGVLKLGNAGGTAENIMRHRLYQPGNVGLVTKSGGMLNELMGIINDNSNGICEAMAVGGDRFPVSSLADQVVRFENNPAIKLIVLLGELGGDQEIKVAQLLESKKVKKPIIAWISGTGAAAFQQPIQFGHAGARSDTASETAQFKQAALKEGGAIIPPSFEKLGTAIATMSKELGIQKLLKEETPLPVPVSLSEGLRKSLVRHTKGITTSIAKTVNGDPTYGGQNIAQASKDRGLGYIVGLLWFKQEFSESACHMFDLFLKITADHGPAVSGAHNTIVAARAGKDLVSSVASGILTIGPRFGGAVNEAAKTFKQGVDTAISPYALVEQFSIKGEYISGIGHKVKSKLNPDKRVELIKEAASNLTIPQTHLHYAMEIERITTLKNDSLILNVDGVIAASLLDILSSKLSSGEIDSLILNEAFNGFFLAGRTIGLIGHFIDQKRLSQPLYRHPEWDILQVD